MRAFLAGLLMLAVALASGPAMARADPPLVLAAASLQEALTAAADAWAAKRHQRPVLSFAASSALARQAIAGAPADMFISADDAWMDAVAQAGAIRPGTRAVLAANRLVLIAPRSSRVALRIGRDFPIARALGNGRLAIADPDAVPAGRYGRAALAALGVWPSVAERIARAENVRSALALVERGEAPLGIVYATDARASKAVRVVGLFPGNTHPPIVYPVALLKAGRSADAEPFRRFLIGREGRAIFAAHGFVAAPGATGQRAAK